MNFKNFFKLDETFNLKNVELADILSSLQSIKDNLENIKRKDLINMLNSVVSSIVPFLKTKNDKNILTLLQKIAYAIKNDIEENNDFKDTLDSSVYELEKYFSKNSMPINKPSKNLDIDNISKPIEQKPEDVKMNTDLQPETGEKSYVPPLAGDGANNLNNL